jgi:hypothetical protein
MEKDFLVNIFVHVMRTMHFIGDIQKGAKLYLEMNPRNRYSNSNTWKSAASIFNIKEFLDPEDECIIYLRNVGQYLWTT